MGQTMSEKKLELYVHIPFCVRKCSYCDFLSGPADPEQQRRYVDALKAEMDAVMEEAGKPVSSIYIGGGTPSVLPAEWIASLLDKLRERFSVQEDAEISMEANPGTLDESRLRCYRQAGVNRLSLGLQSPRDRELKTLGRIHSCADFLESYEMAREAGFSNINVDLMMALPGQSVKDWEENLEWTARLRPQHISAYSLIIEEGTPFAKRELDLPDEDSEYRMYENTALILEKYGYRQYEISNYALEDCWCRHNVGYWEREDYLGFGLGAASLLGDRRFSNTADMQEYVRYSSRPEKIRKEVQQLTDEEQMEEFMFLGLRMTRGVSIPEFERLFGCSIWQEYGKVLDKYLKMEMLCQEGHRIFLSREGIHVSNVIMAEFLHEKD